MKLLLSKDLTPLKEKAERTIDVLAESCRGKYITLGAGQSMVYGQKEREAEAISADPSINPNLVPHLAREATGMGVSLLDMATAVLIKANEWRTVSPPIEETRLTTKAAIRQATSPSAIDALVAEAKSIFEQTA